jgi:hypothetical protein
VKKSIRSAVVKRDKNCVKCGRAVDNSCAVHHRKLRSQGGKDAMSNLIALCHPCHNLGTESVHLNPKKSGANGWIVKSHQEPQEVPVLYHGSWVLLDDSGEITQVEVSDV